MILTDEELPARDDVGDTDHWQRATDLQPCTVCKEWRGCLRHKTNKNAAACLNVLDYLGERVRGAGGIAYTLYDRGRLIAAVREQLLRTLHLFHPDGVIEIRVINTGDKGCTAAGYFESPEQAVRAILEWEFTRFPTGIYFVLNPLHPATISRSPNRLTEYLKTTASDNDVTRLRWLFLDLDAGQPAGTSSTPDELESSRQLAHAVRAYLRDEAGWPDPPLWADSGNGIHLLYAIDLPNDPGSRTLLQKVLQGVQAEVGRPFAEKNSCKVHVDEKTFNAARIDKLYGTTARKGCAMPDRPWRRSRLLALDGGEVVT